MFHSSTSISRRSLLSAAVSTMSLTVFPGAAIAKLCYRPEQLQRVSERLLASFSDINAPAAIGRRYLKEHRVAGDIPRLCKELLSECSSTEQTCIRDVLMEKIRSDFSRSDIVLVDGWVLSATEVRLCTLASLVEASVS